MRLFLHRMPLNRASLPFRLALEAPEGHQLAPRDAVLLFDRGGWQEGSAAIALILAGTGTHGVLQRLALPLPVVRECVALDEWPGDWLEVPAADMAAFGGAAGVVDYWLQRALWQGAESAEGVREGVGSYRLRVRDELALLERRLAEPPRLTETLSPRQSLDDAFRVAVKSRYRFACALCGAARVSPAGQFEVEAVPIYPRAQQGALDVRNGLALCRLHAWALNQGLVALSDEGRLLLHPDMPDEPAYQPLREYAGAPLAEPMDGRGKADALFAQAHRELHGFA